MLINQWQWTAQKQWVSIKTTATPITKGLVLVFGDRMVLSESKRYDEIKAMFGDSQIICCSTSGEILNNQVALGTISLTAIQFEHSETKCIQYHIDDFENSMELGKQIVSELAGKNLKHMLVFSDGGMVNGSELAKGLTFKKSTVPTTGGLAGDDARFQQTLVGLNQAPQPGYIVGVGLYSEKLSVGYGSYGGWDTFGVKRIVTKSKENVLYELDGKPALELYKEYLGEKSEELPASALLFPLNLQLSEDSEPLVRTILSIDEQDNSMTFAGDLPEGCMVQLMKANFDRLIDGSYEAAHLGKISMANSKPEFALLISCVGRRLVLDQAIEEEIDCISEVIGEDVPKAGFYSYGEIAPFSDTTKCELHNQTMTVTFFKEG